jgi:hypothetical protein
MRVNPDKCIFCGSPGPLTDEHIWGDWILKGKHVPRTSNKHKIGLTFRQHSAAPPVSTTRTKAGDPLGANLHLVCGKCNNEWMSRIQDDAKPYLTPLFSGSQWAIGASAQQKISTWAAMVTMTSEYLSRDSSTRAIPQSDRDYLRSHNRPPPNWRIWIGTYDRSKWVGQWVRTSAPILDIANPTDRIEAQPNTQTTTFIIGKLYVYVMSSHFPEHTALWDWRPTPRAKALLVEIYPVKQMIVAWPRHSLTDADAQQFAVSFYNEINAADRMIRR